MQPCGIPALLRSGAVPVSESIKMLFRLVQTSKASLPMLVTLAGMVIAPRSVQNRKA